MTYYGNSKTKKYKVLGAVDYIDSMDEETPVGFMNKKGFLVEYLLEAKTYITNTNLRKENIKNDYVVLDPDKIEELRAVNYGGETYYMGVYPGLKDELWLMKEIPAISDDKYFKWKQNRKHVSLESKIVDGNFEFCCIAKQDGDAIVDVKYCKCQNKHRNRVTIERIEVQNATNEDIIDAIKCWRKEFAKEVVA